jgi:alcohol oxidase
MHELTHADGRNGRAAGIDYTSYAISCQGQWANGELVTVKATKLVIVSAGAFGSPAILERSGIGPPSVLERNNIHVLVDSPGIGENYQGMFRTPEGPRFEKTEVISQII